MLDFFFIYKFIYLFLAVLAPHCCTWSPSSCGERGPLFVAVHGLCGGLPCCGAQAPGAQASVVVARGLQSVGSVVVAHGLTCSTACGILPDQSSTHVPCIGRRTPNHCATREVPYAGYFLKEQSSSVSHRVIEMFSVNFEFESNIMFQIFFNSKMKYLIFPSSTLLTFKN